MELNYALVRPGRFREAVYKGQRVAQLCPCTDVGRVEPRGALQQRDSVRHLTL